ncbi:hypothetical protein [Aliivibrio kagoshimensis]|uniref:hypothetical protein n=1 Tax=Aliivibrio kagoshimensis TaxID=2910230 RepID=UPI003D0FABD1
MNRTPQHLQDAKDLLSTDGFATNGLWYHGTSSALLPSIQEQGLNRSGDIAINQAAKNTMTTIGNHYTELVEPVFLTQSKELAYYWASQTVHKRHVRFEGEEEPIVIAINLPQPQREKIKPDVGAVSLLQMESGERFMANLATIYQNSGLEAPDIDLRNTDRMDFLRLLGMAYINQDIHIDCVQLVIA